ncbi:hypothetical protein [Escherichia sp. E1130]|uniref:hypothetical protein n=1 Tax=Escherichia sp. E1130 TaxID=2041645 RepID=UPI0010805EE1|nr:hypothetical protein [Escherichia sp. E1130]TGC28040.1 hypothetical protein CQJ27_03925 [Escherichia sp. E1130]TLI70118.1 hypothetical protein FEK66_15970 [Escherichia sp. E1130]
MRFYDIQIFNAADASGNPGALYRRYSSLKNGVYNPGSLMVEFDLLRFGESTPQGQSSITVWGISPQEMQQARQDMFGKSIKMWVGMSKGLPLANPAQSGLVLDGTIWQVLGNWQGTELRMDLIVTAGAVSSVNPAPLAPINLTVPWNKGIKLSVALTQCFQNMGGGYRFSISVSDRLINNFDSNMFCGSLTELASKLKSLSKGIIRDANYSGVEITMVNGKEIRVFDNDFDNHQDKDSKKSASYRNKKPVQIDFKDLVGQPTWVQFGTVSIPCVMRSDIQVGDYIRMPKKLRPMIQASSYSQFRDDSAFTGDFLVSSVRLLGNSRQPDANSWVTVLEAHPTGGIAAQ